MLPEANKGKNLIIEVDGEKYFRYPIKTKLITPKDKDILPIVEEFTKGLLLPDDIVFISEKAVAVTQGRSYHLSDIKPSWLARKLSKYVMRTPAGIGLGSPETMELAIEEVGVVRILFAAMLGAITKIFGIKGVFYMVAGDGARSIDGAVPYAIPPYNEYVSKGPIYPDKIAKQIASKLNCHVAIVDANDLGVNILGMSNGVDKDFIAKAIKDNPLGQSSEQTPVGIIRKA